MKVLCVVFMFTLVLSCNSRQQIEINTSSSKQEMLFTSPGFNDSLVLFMRSIDSIPNPYGLTIEYMVRYSIEDKDTIITFHAAVDFTPATLSMDYKHSPSSDIIVGGMYYGNKPVLVRSNGVYNYPLLRKDLLSDTVGVKIDSIKMPIDNPRGWDAPMSRTDKKYKYSYPDSLFLYEYWHLGKLVFEK